MACDLEEWFSMAPGVHNLHKSHFLSSLLKYCIIPNASALPLIYLCSGRRS